MQRVWQLGRVTLGLWLILLGGSALAQVATSSQSPFYTGSPAADLANRPNLSPFLNLLRGGSPAANYYLGVVPERDRRLTDAQFRTAIQDLERRPDTVPGGEDLLPTLPQTGHAAQFMNYSTYFNTGYSSRYAPFASPRAAGPRRAR